MYYINVIFIAFALALDAFSVALGAGSYFGKTNKRQKFRLSFHFGLFQFLMPIIGWIAGFTVVSYVADYDHWIAFGLLGLIGSKMIKDGIKSNEGLIKTDITRGFHLVSLSIATSLDALAVGFSISLLKEKIIFPAIVIGIVAAVMTLSGIYLGERLSARFGSKASIIGGIVLILIGTEIVLNHLGFL